MILSVQSCPAVSQALVQVFGVGNEFSAGDVEKQMNQDAADSMGKPRPRYPRIDCGL